MGVSSLWGIRGMITPDPFNDYYGTVNYPQLIYTGLDIQVMTVI